MDFFLVLTTMTRKYNNDTEKIEFTVNSILNLYFLSQFLGTSNRYHILIGEW